MDYIKYEEYNPSNTISCNVGIQKKKKEGNTINQEDKFVYYRDGYMSVLKGDRFFVHNNLNI